LDVRKKLMKSIPRFKTTAADVGTLTIALLAGAALGVVLFKQIARKGSGNRRVPQPEKTVDVTQYLGKWYELARYENRFEHGCEAVTAEYKLLGDGRINVRNSCRDGSLDGRLRVSDGKAKIVDGSGNAKLKVSFFGPFYVGNYWVLDRAEDYSWSIVGEPSGRYLWILAREPKPAEVRRQMLFRRAAELGYDTTRLRVTRH
jgi:apolipoprotein D and lipocalin family protein